MNKFWKINVISLGISFVMLPNIFGANILSTNFQDPPLNVIFDSSGNSLVTQDTLTDSILAWQGFFVAVPGSLGKQKLVFR